jgi:ribonucleoside-diphosphate reductase alpha chain
VVIINHYLLANEDLYDAQGNKRIARRFSHLPKTQTLALVQGLLETDGGVSRGKEITLPIPHKPQLKVYVINVYA